MTKEEMDKMISNMNYGKSDDALKAKFYLRFSPFAIKGFEMPERFTDDEPVPEDETVFRTVKRNLGEQLKTDPLVCAKFVSRRILDRLAEDLKEDDGTINAVKLFAVLGAVAGYELMRGIVSSVSDFTPDELARMKIMIIGMKNGENYLMGDLVGNQFINFYFSAAQDNTLSIEPLMKQSEICAKNIGTPAYWETSLDLGMTPLVIAENFGARFNGLLETYTRYPLERVVAYALAAVELIRQSEKAMKKERALEILAEYGWRTSHFIA